MSIIILFNRKSCNNEILNITIIIDSVWILFYPNDMLSILINSMSKCTQYTVVTVVTRIEKRKMVSISKTSIYAIFLETV